MSRQTYKLDMSDVVFVKDSDGDFIPVHSSGDAEEGYITKYTIADLNIEVTPVDNTKPSGFPGGTLVKVAGEKFTYYRSHNGWVAGGMERYNGRIEFPPEHLDIYEDRLEIIYDPRDHGDGYQETK